MQCTREPYVAGKFYPGSKAGIKDLLVNIRQNTTLTEDISFQFKNLIGAILPHAGFVYSGYQTVPLFEILKKNHLQYESFVILHPLHQGGYQPFATDNCSEWETPMGRIRVDKEFLSSMDIHHSDHLLKYEHSAEVLLPFLQFYGYEDSMIIPIGISTQNPDISREISHQLSMALFKTKRKIFILASSDFSHFLSPEKGYNEDQKVLDCIQSFDIESLYHKVISDNISICGYGPIMTLIDFARNHFEEVKSKLLARGHSGQVYPSSKVVDYISLVFYNQN